MRDKVSKFGIIGDIQVSNVCLFTQDVGRSCILVSMGGKNIMFDCGMHMGFNDEVQQPSQAERWDCIFVLYYTG